MGQTIIDHDIRVKLRLNCLEYCLADFLSKGLHHTASIIEYLGITNSQMNDLFLLLASMGITQKDKYGVVSCTTKWTSEFKKEKTIDKKIEDFRYSLSEFKSKYGDIILLEFFNYWSELNKSQTKMRWELEKTWNTPKRLTRWHNNNNKGQVQSKDKTTYIIK